MKVTLKYGERWYGNDYSNPNFTAKVAKAASSEAIDIELRFASPQAGRSANWATKGFVSGATLLLSVEEARALAAALLWHLDCVDRDTVNLTFGKAPEVAA